MNKKGFTLIELLAVIVILAIIAIIAVPIVINIINESRISAAERSMENFVEAVKLAEARYQTQSKLGTSGSWEQIKDLVKLDKGEQVTERYAYIDEKGQILSARATITGYYCIYKSSEGSKCIKGKIVYAWYEELDKKNIGDKLTKYTIDYTTLEKNYFLKHVIDENGIIFESWTCAIHNNSPLCIQGGSFNYYGYSSNSNNYTGNVRILFDKYSQDPDVCSFSSVSSGCDDGSTYFYLYSDRIYAGDSGETCEISDNGTSYCLLPW